MRPPGLFAPYIIGPSLIVLPDTPLMLMIHNIHNNRCESPCVPLLPQNATDRLLDIRLGRDKQNSIESRNVHRLRSYCEGAQDDSPLLGLIQILPLHPADIVADVDNV